MRLSLSVVETRSSTAAIEELMGKLAAFGPFDLGRTLRRDGAASDHIVRLASIERKLGLRRPFTASVRTAELVRSVDDRQVYLDFSLGTLASGPGLVVEQLDIRIVSAHYSMAEAQTLFEDHFRLAPLTPGLHLPVELGADEEYHWAFKVHPDRSLVDLETWDAGSESYKLFASIACGHDGQPLRLLLELGLDLAKHFPRPPTTGLGITMRLVGGPRHLVLNQPFNISLTVDNHEGGDAEVSLSFPIDPEAAYLNLDPRTDCGLIPAGCSRTVITRFLAIASGRHAIGPPKAFDPSNGRGLGEAHCNRLEIYIDE